MYDELVTSLREATGWENASAHYSLMKKAADAIEELSKRASEWETIAESWQKACEGLESRIPCWIPVTEKPLLKVGDDGYNGYLVMANGFCEVADYTVDESGVLCFFVDGEYEPDVTHFMPIPELPKLDGVQNDE